MKDVLSRKELDPQRCGTPGCNCPGPLILNSRCHPRRGTDLSYDWTTGLLTVRCRVCTAFVCHIAVADVVVPGSGPGRPS